ncbi:MAG TPA: bifunctional YncE family protein/alkaline phosphatase family protein [Thermoanaerobaculia bacterium]|nr:bifunctional YncE family protein/alkaline phosphatase family protein [Thermoanaerobaculia bacterium]
MGDRFRVTTCLLLLLVSSLACRPGRSPAAPENAVATMRLPTGVHLDPAGPSFDVGNMPLAIVPAPSAPGAAPGRFAVLLSGWRQQGVQVVDAGQGKVLQTLAQPGAFLGLAFSPDGRTLYASGGGDDAVWRYTWKDGAAVFRDRLELAAKEKDKPGTRYPAGLAVSPYGSRLYVAENLADSLAVLDVAGDAGDGKILQHLPVGRFPYGVAVAPDGTVWVSAWGGDSVAAFAPDGGGTLKEAGRVAVGVHPSALLLNAAGTRLFAASASTDRVAVVDTHARRVVATLQDPPPSGPDEGSTPNALALDAAGSRLFVAEADANAVAVFALSAATSGVSGARGADKLAGRIPTQWYPTALAADRAGSLLVVNGKGRGTGPNPGKSQPGLPNPPDSTTYTLGQLNGTITVLPAAALGGDLAAASRRVAAANGWTAPSRRRYPPFEHVVYILKENRTYDQVLGDLPQGDGDKSLTFFPREVAPNHHALAERFGLYDRFFVNAEVSNQGHPWSTSGYVTDYTEKTTPSSYSDRRGDGEAGEADEPAGGWLWGIAREKGISFRNYGETMEKAKGPGGETVWKSKRKGVAEVSNLKYPGWDLTISDQIRADIWLADLRESEKIGKMPALQLLWLTNDHTAGARAGQPTPRAYMADNDYALGRILEALSKSRFWKNTVVFVLEDDAQSGPDHVDSHRSVLLTVSAYNHPGTVHRFVNTTDVLATIEDILGLRAFSHFDHFGRPLSDVFTATPDLRPYEALPLAVPWTEVNPPKTAAAALSARLNLSIPDSGQDALFNTVLWRAVKGETRQPEARRMPVLELQRGR